MRLVERWSEAIVPIDCSIVVCNVSRGVCQLMIVTHLRLFISRLLFLKCISWRNRYLQITSNLVLKYLSRDQSKHHHTEHHWTLFAVPPYFVLGDRMARWFVSCHGSDRHWHFKALPRPMRLSFVNIDVLISKLLLLYLDTFGQWVLCMYVCIYIYIYICIYIYIHTHFFYYITSFHFKQTDSRFNNLNVFSLYLYRFFKVF